MRYFYLTLLLLISAQTLFAAYSAQSNLTTTIEVGMFVSEPDSVIENIDGKYDFQDDFKYKQFNASYFGIDINHQYAYIPNIAVNYFTQQESQSTPLDKNITIANDSYTGKVKSVTDYSVLNTLLYYTFKQGSDYNSIMGYNLYTGHLEVDVGINIKYIDWSFIIQDLNNTQRSSSWITVKGISPAPYLAFRYNIWRISLYTKASALAMSETEILDFEGGVIVQLFQGLHLSASYMYESFKATEGNDKIDFITGGYKASLLYKF